MYIIAPDTISRLKLLEATQWYHKGRVVTITPVSFSKEVKHYTLEFGDLYRVNSTHVAYGEEEAAKLTTSYLRYGTFNGKPKEGKVA